jgi:peptidoglycan hydrolase-like protein with peptidoglycan-binding domain
VNGVDVAADDGNPGYGRLRRRRTILLAVAALAVAASAGGLLLSTTIKSPAQQAAQTKAPGLTRLTAPVQRTVIRTVVQANGMVTTPPQVSSLSGGGTAGGAAGGGNVQQVVTKIFRHRGSFVSPGNVIIEVAGRPLFVFQGTVPAYRDMAPGESGSDVAQLQAGLQSLGFGTGSDASGVYGPGTAAAVAAFYQSIGYSAPVVSLGPKADRGAEIPLSEIMFVPRFPAQVVGLGGSVGSIVKDPLVTLSLGTPAIRGQLNPAYGSLVRPGMHVTITAQGSSASVRGTITSVGQGAQSGKSISGGIYLPMHIKPHGPLPPSMGPGQDVILSISAAQTSAPVLAVPEAAVFGGQDGKDYVSKVTGPSAAARVRVQVITEGDGLVGIRPVPAGALRPGDSVVTGENYLTSPAGTSLRSGSLPPSLPGRDSVRVVSP